MTLRVAASLFMLANATIAQAQVAAPPAPSNAAPNPGTPVLPSWTAPPLRGAWNDTRNTPDARAKALVAAMTQDEKLTLVFGYFATDFPPSRYRAPKLARAGSAGFIPGIPRLGIPAQHETDAGIGVATQSGWPIKRERTALPSNLAIAASWDRALAYAGGAMIGDEARRSGFNVMLAGGVNLLRDPRNGRNFEYGGEDPLLAGAMVGEQVAGIQSQHVVSTIKHFAFNDQETARNTGNSIVDHAAARVSDLLAFQLAIERADPGAIMCSYNLVDGVHACENSWLLTDVLRGDWGFKGYVMSDWGATHSTAAANAGLDQDSGFPFDTKPFFGRGLRDAIERGDVTPARLDLMVHRILRSMFAQSTFDLPVTEQPIDFVAHAATTRAAAEASIVLLKNTGNVLPLATGMKRIAVIGGHADKGVLAGGGSSLTYPVGGNAVPGLLPTAWPGPIMYYPSSPLDEIRKRAPGATVRFADGTDPAAAAALARDSDVVIVFATQWTSETFDVPMALDGNQDALIAAVAAANRNTVVVLETGGPVAMPWVDQVGAVIEAWYPGTAGGAAIANVLSGATNPSGHLPATFARNVGQLPDPAPPHAGDVVYKEGATVGYKWFDAHGTKPLYAFGHGLSYTRFDMEGLRAVTGGKDAITARFTVRNVGGREGAAVAQIYVAPVAGGWEAPKRLGGFAKVKLAPGTAQTGTVTIDPRLLAVWDEAGHGWRIAGGQYKVMLAGSANDVRETAIVTIAAQQLPASSTADR